MESYAAPAQVWAAALVFTRVGAILMLLPGLGDATVPVRIRLSFALLLTLVIAPLVSARLPGLPSTVGAMGGYVLKEAITGLMIGALLRSLLATLAVAGEVVSLQTTLAFAQTANPLQAQPGTTLASFLTLMGVTLLFAGNVHHMFIAAIARSYDLFQPSHALPIHDGAVLAVRTLGDAFALGVQLAAPVMIFALVFNIATGFVGRVMPQFQVFFAATPLSVLLGLSVFTLSLGVMGLVWVDRYRQLAQIFLGG